MRNSDIIQDYTYIKVLASLVLFYYPFFYYENTVILICVKHNINKIHHLFEKQKQIFYALPKFS